MADWIAERSPRPWRLNLRIASFRGAQFHVEVGAKSSGRRIVLHEYPKRDLPYAEDMGRRAKTFQIAGYLIEGDKRLGTDYRRARDRLIDALETEGGGLLIHPTMGELQVSAGPYSCIESRERGGYCAFDMAFVEAGVPGDFTAFQSTQSIVNKAVDQLNSVIKDSFLRVMQDVQK